VRYCTERWADEDAARLVGDRRLVARTVGKAALITRRNHATPAAALAMAGSMMGRLRGAGPVPRRVAALLTTPPPQRRLLLAIVLAVLAIAVLSSIEAARDLHTLFELARTSRE
jgi:hypothetical protein